MKTILRVAFHRPVNRLLRIAIILALTSAACLAQGTIFFNNRTSTGDAKIADYDGNGFGLQGGLAQLFLVLPGGAYQALNPITPFRNSSAAAAFFVEPVTVTVPGVPAGSPATFVLRAWYGAPAFEDAALARGETEPVTVAALGGIPPGGGAPIPTPDLAGLQGFTLPEPSSVALAILGVISLALCRSR